MKPAAQRFTLIAMDVAENLESLGFSVYHAGSVKAAVRTIFVEWVPRQYRRLESSS